LICHLGFSNRKEERSSLSFDIPGMNIPDDA